MRLFLDDERFPPDSWSQYDFIVFRTAEAAKQWILETKCPQFISFDHDLGEGIQTGYDLAKWLVEMDLDKPGFIPDNFEYKTHSANPVGARNIHHLLNNYLQSRK